jgi:hypothetical protein
MVRLWYRSVVMPVGVPMIVVVSVVVKQHRGAVKMQNPTLERLSQRFGSERFGGGAIRDDLVGEHQHPVAAPGLVEVMGGHDHESAGISFFAYHRQNGLLAGKVETGDGFIEKKNLGVAGHTSGDQDSLALAERERAERSIQKVGDFETGRDLVESSAISTVEPAKETFAS